MIGGYCTVAGWRSSLVGWSPWLLGWKLPLVSSADETTSTSIFRCKPARSETAGCHPVIDLWPFRVDQTQRRHPWNASKHPWEVFYPEPPGSSTVSSKALGFLDVFGTVVESFVHVLEPGRAVLTKNQCPFTRSAWWTAI